MIKQFFINKLNGLNKLKRELGYQVLDAKRSLFHQETLSQVVNTVEYRIIGLRRSGNHVITNWIKEQQEGEVWYLNNIKVYKNPYRELYFYYPKPHLKLEATGNFIRKDSLIYSYEDCDLSEISDPEFAKKHDLYFGKSQARYDVLILRDPFNFFASRLMASRKKINKLDMSFVRNAEQTVAELWIDYAKEFLGQTNRLVHNKVVINYNLWVSDENYRAELATKLNLQSANIGIDAVKRNSGGSSFDGRAFDGQGSRMDVTGRWLHFKDDSEYLQLLNNQEVLRYSNEIFGQIPGTEFLLDKFAQ